MRVVHVSETAIAGTCWSRSEAFKEAGYESACICPAGYGDGRTMPTDYEMPPSDDALARLNAADVIVCYQGRPYLQPWYPQRKPTVFVYVSPNDARYVTHKGEADGWPWSVEGQHQTRLYGPGAIPSPGYLPLKHPWFRPAPKPKDYVRIVYSPSNRAADGWSNKGFAATREVLRRLVIASGDGYGIPPVDVDIITKTPLGECLRRKATAHIAIDECVTGAFHACTLQAMAHGSIVVNNADELCVANVRTVTGGAEAPFTRCGIGALQETLRALVALGPAKLTEMGAANRQWMERHWQPADLIKRNFVPLLEWAMEHAA